MPDFKAISGGGEVHRKRVDNIIQFRYNRIIFRNYKLKYFSV